MTLKKSHLQLLNEVGTGRGVYKFSTPIDKNEDTDETENIEKRDYRRQRSDFLHFHNSYNTQRDLRIQQRDPNLLLSHYDYIVIWTYKILSDDLIRDWGLVLERRTNLGLKLLARVDNEEKFHIFMGSILEYAQDDTIIDAVPEKYIQLTLIQKFTLLSSNDIVSVHAGHNGNISTTLQFTSIDDDSKRQILSKLRSIVGNDNLYEASPQLGLYEASFLSMDQIQYVADNLDIFQSIQSFPTFHVNPTRFKMVQFTQTLNIKNVDIDSLPIVGIIDTGIRDVPAINPFIVERVCLEDNMSVLCGHGTNVASLAIFGRQSLFDPLIPHARVFSIQALENENGQVSLTKLRQKIVYGIEHYNIKIFNVSLAEPNGMEINGDLSSYARMLDEIAYYYDVLFVTATGNTDWTGEEELPRVPVSLYDPQDPTQTRFTNIGSPAENMNGLTVGAVNHGSFPATYTKKSHLDFSMPIGNSLAEQAIVNYNLMKPDILTEGGDDDPLDDTKWIEVIDGSNINFIKKVVGTSFATPVVTNLCAQVLKVYPSLGASAIKAILINTALPTGITRLSETKNLADQRNAVLMGNSHFKKHHIQPPEHIARMIEGHGAIPTDDTEIIFSSKDSVTFVGQMEIENEQIKCVNIILPERLRTGKDREKMLHISTTLCFEAQSIPGNDIVTYNPYHVSFKFLRGNENIEQVANNLQYVRKESHEARITKSDSNHIKSTLDSWSETPLPSYKKRLFSNTQHREFLLNAGDIINVDKNIALAFRCVTKPNFDTTPVQFSYVVKIEIDNKRLLDSDFSLYDELRAINTVQAIATAESIAEAEAEN